MKLLFVGDVIGKPGRQAVRGLLPGLVDRHRADYVVVNVENAAGGFGVTPEILQELADLPIDCLTSGNHIWDKKEGVELLGREPRLLRPANYPDGNPGVGVFIGETAGGIPVAVLNLEGQVFMKNVDSPFRAADRLLAALPPQVKVDHGRLPCRGDQREAGAGLLSRRPGERGPRHPHPRAHRRRARAGRGHGAGHRRRHDRAVRLGDRFPRREGAAALPAADARSPSRSPSATCGWRRRWSTSTKRPARRAASSACWYGARNDDRAPQDHRPRCVARRARPAPGLGDRHHVQRRDQHRRVPGVGVVGRRDPAGRFVLDRPHGGAGQALPRADPPARVLRLGGAEELVDRPRRPRLGADHRRRRARARSAGARDPDAAVHGAAR